MKCPTDDTELQMTERQGVEIDYCPKCRGVWLDRGELDKILERSEQFTQKLDNNSPQNPYPSDAPYGYGNHGGGDYGKHGSRRKGLLGELFDF